MRTFFKGSDLSPIEKIVNLELADEFTGGNIAPSAPLAYFTKQGKMVHFRTVMSNIDTTGLTSGNNLVIRNFPYLANGTFELTVRADSIAFTGYLTAKLLANVDYMTIADSRPSSTDISITIGNITSGASDIIISGVYLTDE